MQTMDRTLVDLFRQGSISRDVAAPPPRSR